MWNMITHFLTFTGGMSAGVVLMCFLQTGKQADKEFEDIGSRNLEPADQDSSVG